MSETVTGQTAGEGTKKTAAQKKLGGPDGKRNSGSDVIEMIEKIREEKEQEAKKRSISVSTPPVPRAAAVAKAPPLSLSASATTPTQKGKVAKGKKKRNSSNNFVISSPDYTSFRNLADQLGGSPFDRAKQLGSLPSPADHRGGGEPPTRPEKGVEGKLKSAFLSMRRKKKKESEQSGPQSLTMLFTPPEPAASAAPTSTKTTEQRKEQKAPESEKPKEEVPIEEKDLNKKKGTIRGKKGKGKGKEKKKGKGNKDKETKDENKDVPEDEDGEEFEELQNVFALALYDFDALPEHEYELSFKEGEIIKITEKPPGDWWTGETANGCGYFPHTFVKLLTPRTIDALKLTPCQDREPKAQEQNERDKEGKKKKGKKQKKKEKKKGDKKKKKKEKKGENTEKGESTTVADVIQTEEKGTEGIEKEDKQAPTGEKKEVNEEQTEKGIGVEKPNTEEDKAAPKGEQAKKTEEEKESEKTVEIEKKEENVEQENVKEAEKETKEEENKTERETKEKELHVENDENVPVQVQQQPPEQPMHHSTVRPEPEKQQTAIEPVTPPVVVATTTESEPASIKSAEDQQQQIKPPQLLVTPSSPTSAESGPILGMGRGRGRVIQGKSRLGRTMRKGTDDNNVRVGTMLVAKTAASTSSPSSSSSAEPTHEAGADGEKKPPSGNEPSNTESTPKEEKDQHKPEQVVAEKNESNPTPAAQGTEQSEATTESQEGEGGVPSPVARRLKHPRTRSTMARVRTPAPLTQGTRKRASTDPEPEDPKKYDSVDRRTIDSKPIILTSPPSSATASTLRPRPTPKILYKDPAKREAQRAASSPPLPAGGSVASIVNTLNSNVTVRPPSSAANANHHTTPPLAAVGRGGPVVVGGGVPPAGRGSPILPGRGRGAIAHGGGEGRGASPLSHSTGSVGPAGLKSLSKSAGPVNPRPKLHPVSASPHPVNTHTTPPTATPAPNSFIPPNTNIPVFNKALQMQNSLNAIHKPTHQQPQQHQPQQAEKREDIKYVPYAELKKRPPYLDCTKLESYLTDEEFQKVLRMTKEEFYSMAGWRQQRCKKEAGLV